MIAGDTIIEESCWVCEHFSGCRGQCPGTYDNSPCTGFSLAENRSGDCAPETGDWQPRAASRPCTRIARITAAVVVTVTSAMLAFSPITPTEADQGPGRYAALNHRTRLARSGPNFEPRTSNLELEKTGQVPLLPGRPRRQGPAVTSTAGLADLFAAIRRVESGGDDRAVGDGGMSRGAYQITAAYWRDGCEYGGVRWDYRTLVWSRPHGEQVMRWYWSRHGARTDEQRARMHNGGPEGASKPATLGYWRKVKRQMVAGSRWSVARHTTAERSEAGRTRR